MYGGSLRIAVIDVPIKRTPSILSTPKSLMKVVGSIKVAIWVMIVMMDIVARAQPGRERGILRGFVCGLLFVR
jgi:hypothetical protein